MEKDPFDDGIQTIRNEVIRMLFSHGHTLQELNSGKLSNDLEILLAMGEIKEKYDLDSLDLVEITMDDDPDDSTEGEGGIGVREPRPPRPNTDMAAAAIRFTGS